MLFVGVQTSEFVRRAMDIFVCSSSFSSAFVVPVACDRYCHLPPKPPPKIKGQRSVGATWLLYPAKPHRSQQVPADLVETEVVHADLVVADESEVSKIRKHYEVCSSSLELSSLFRAVCDATKNAARLWYAGASTGQQLITYLASVDRQIPSDDRQPPSAAHHTGAHLHSFRAAFVNLFGCFGGIPYGTVHWLLSWTPLVHMGHTPHPAPAAPATSAAPPKWCSRRQRLVSNHRRRGAVVRECPQQIEGVRDTHHPQQCPKCPFSLYRPRDPGPWRSPQPCRQTLSHTPPT